MQQSRSVLGWIGFGRNVEMWGRQVYNRVRETRTPSTGPHDIGIPVGVRLLRTSMTMHKWTVSTVSERALTEPRPPLAHIAVCCQLFWFQYDLCGLILYIYATHFYVHRETFGLRAVDEKGRMRNPVCMNCHICLQVIIWAGFDPLNYQMYYRFKISQYACSKKALCVFQRKGWRSGN